MFDVYGSVEVGSLAAGSGRSSWPHINSCAEPLTARRAPAAWELRNTSTLFVSTERFAHATRSTPHRGWRHFSCQCHRRAAGLPELIERARGEAIFLERRGEVEAVVISPVQDARMSDALEDAEDVAPFDEAMAEEGENIPWAEVKTDLGWA